MNNLISILTAHTCGEPCWQAQEDVCRCSCGGANHGILNNGGDKPNRTRKLDGRIYELIAIIQGRQDGECWHDVFKRENIERSQVTRERFPDLDPYAYGSWEPETIPPVVTRKLSASQLKWAESKAIKGAYSAVWACPVNTPYTTKLERRAS